MLSFDVSRTLAVPAEAAWKVLVDTRLWPRWGPSVRAVRTEGGPLIAHGSTGRVQTSVGIWLPFEITDWQETRRWSWKVAGVPATGHRVETLGPDRCRAVMEVPAWAPAYAIVCQWGLRRLGRLAEEAVSRG